MHLVRAFCLAGASSTDDFSFPFNLNFDPEKRSVACMEQNWLLRSPLVLASFVPIVWGGGCQGSSQLDEPGGAKTWGNPPFLKTGHHPVNEQQGV